MNRHEKMQLLADWVERCFGKGILCDIKERCARLLEEAIELAQAEGMSREYAEKILAEVYGRPLKGDPWQEAGGVALTLLAYCSAKSWNPANVELAELRRILAKSPSHFRNRQQQKADVGTAIAPRISART